jgi:hypothetical protein
MNPTPFPSTNLQLHQLTTPCHSSSTSSSTTTTTTTEQATLSTLRITAYVSNPAHSHTQHRHASIQQAIATHTAAMKAYLEVFDATMAQYEQ